MPNGADAYMFFVVVFALMSVWAAFWLIRLAVRYGMNDALRMNEEWLKTRREEDPRLR